MKDLLEKLTRSTITVYLKSGERMDNVVIEAVIKNIAVANYDGKVTLIEIPHIAYVSAERGVMEVMEAVYKNQQGVQQGKKDTGDD